MTDFKDKKLKITCIFCGQSQRAGAKLIGAKNIYMCEDCIRFSYKLLNDRKPTVKEKKEINFEDLQKPKKIKQMLDEYVIGQDESKKVLSVAVYNHYKRISLENKNQKDDVIIQKSNVLLIGQTGTGKTLLAETLARVLDVPFAIADATSLTEAGYVGEDVENIILKLVQNAEYDVKRAQKGIIYIDEIDKITRRRDNPSLTRDVSGEGVQQALLKILEGTIANVPQKGGRKHPQQEYIKVNTKDILFICGGAFSGLEKIIEKRTNKKSIGFKASKTDKNYSKNYEVLSKVEVKDLINYGLIPEFVGRFPLVSVLHELDVKALLEILQKPKNALIKQYKKLFSFDNIDLKFNDDALEKVARLAIEKGVGARGLRAILEEAMLEIMYEAPENKKNRSCIVDLDIIEKKDMQKII